MKINVIILIFAISLAISSSAEAKRYWPSDILLTWTLGLNNGVAYISSPQFAPHCSYTRGQINMDGTEFNKAQYAYAMAAKAKGKKLQYVVDDTQTTCIITGLQEVD
jgi:hypothetical protein